MVDRKRDHEEENMILGDGEIVQQPDVGHLDPRLPDFVAALVDLEHGDDVTAEAVCLVAEGDNVASDRADFGVRGKGLFPRQSTIEGVNRIDRLEGLQIHRGRRAVLLKRKDHVLVIDDVGVGRASTQALGARVVQVRVAVHRHQRPPRLVLRNEALGLGITGPVVDAPVLDAEQPDMTFAVKRYVARRQRILRVRAGRIETAREVARYLSLDDAVTYRDFGAHRGEIAATKSGVRSRLAGARPLIGLR